LTSPSALRPPPTARGRLSSAFGAVRGWLVAVGMFSGLINLLALTGSIFMLQVYDRVLTSRSVPTLVALAIIAAALYLLQGVLDLVRTRMLVRMGSRLDEILGEKTYSAVLTLPLKTRGDGDGLQPIRDLDSIRSFLTGPGPSAILDLPWIPIYLAFVFILHAWLGWLATAGAVALIILTLTTEALSRKPAKRVFAEGNKRQTLAAAGRRNAEVLKVMGFAERHQARWLAANAAYLSAHQHASDITGGLGALSKVFRALLQSAILALGAWLTILGEVSGGAIIASSIVSSRALAPIEQAIANWKAFLSAREARGRLGTLLSGPDAASLAPMQLPPPNHTLNLEGVFAGPPGATTPVVSNVSFRLEAGQGLGIIGPSASGKTTLARAIVGAWPVLRGSVRLDGATLDQWAPAELGRHMGYLPQDIELFAGTVAENISRFEPEADPEAVIAAARAANVHDMIVRLPGGYETQIGAEGTTLSAGQRQRLALARALYRDPFLVVLDEPNSNLDADGEAALSKAIAGIRARRGIVIVIAHRPSAIAAVDLLAVMANGVMAQFGAKEDILAKVIRQPVDNVPQPG